MPQASERQDATVRMPHEQHPNTAMMHGRHSEARGDGEGVLGRSPNARTLKTSPNGKIVSTRTASYRTHSTGWGGGDPGGARRRRAPDLSF